MLALWEASGFPLQNPLVERDVRADPGLVDVEIDTHHFALTHSDDIIDERGIAVVVGPDEHHPNLGLRSLTIDRRHERRVIDFRLQNPFVRILQWGNFLARWLHIHTMASE